MQSHKPPNAEHEPAERLAAARRRTYFIIGAAVGLPVVAVVSLLVLILMVRRSGDANAMLTTCPACQREMAKLAQNCPHCGYSPILAAIVEQKKLAEEAEERRREQEAADREALQQAEQKLKARQAEERAAKETADREEAARMAPILAARRKAEIEERERRQVEAEYAKAELEARDAAATATRQAELEAWREARRKAEAEQRRLAAMTLEEILAMPTPDQRAYRLAKHYGADATVDASGAIVLLDLRSTEIGDAELKHFPIDELKSLTGLNLRNTKISDKAVDWIAKRSRTAKLSLLNVRYTNVTEQRMKRLWLQFAESDFVQNDPEAKQAVTKKRPPEPARKKPK